MMRNKYKLFWAIFLWFITFFSFDNSFASDCAYWTEIKLCKIANDAWDTKELTDFVCIIGTDEEITYQIVLDSLFKKEDEKMDKFIEDLEKEKNRYFWISREKNFIDWLNDIDQAEKYFYEQYAGLCGSTIIEQAMACMPENKTTTTVAKNFFQESDCMKLVNKKIEIFDKVTFSILLLDKWQVKADEKKTYDQWQRKNYDNLLDLMMINIWFIERLWQKWPSKILNTY